MNGVSPRRAMAFPNLLSVKYSSLGAAKGRKNRKRRARACPRPRVPFFLNHSFPFTTTVRKGTGAFFRRQKTEARRQNAGESGVRGSELGMRNVELGMRNLSKRWKPEVRIQKPTKSRNQLVKSSTCPQVKSSNCQIVNLSKRSSC